MAAKSILSTKKICYMCGKGGYLETHHIFNGTANRRLSDQDGLVVKLCPQCHEYVHKSQPIDLSLKREGQRAWMKHYNKTAEDFRARYGKSYL